AFVTLRQNADLWRLPVTLDGRLAGEAPSAGVASSREDSRGAWSPDGRMIAFNSDRAGDMKIWLHDVEHATNRQRTKGSGGDDQPSWSPDGHTLAFFSSRAGAADIWTADVASGRLTRLTQGAATHVNPFISPDGRYIAYQSDEDGRLSPWVM